MTQLIDLDTQIDVAIEKSKYLFDEDVSGLLTQGKECFSCNIQLFKSKEIDEQQHRAIKESINETKQEFMLKASRYLKI